MNGNTAKVTRKAALGLAQLIVIMGLALFAPAGTLRFVEGWIFLLLFFASSLAITVYLARHDPALLERRTQAGPVAEKERSQKAIQGLASVLFLAVIVLPALDRRFGWSHAPLRLDARGYTAKTDSVGSSRSRSPASLVTTTARSLLAVSTTDASITSEVPARPQSVPEASASVWSRTTTAVVGPLSSARSGTWRAPSRQTCARAPAGTTSLAPDASASRKRARTRPSPRSKAMSAPASRRPLVFSRLMETGGSGRS
jgi:hypothetical protein